MTFQGLTWDHPRGYDALAEAARRVNEGRPEPLLTWGKQPLEGFESAPIRDLAAAYDLIVLDHPHIGEAVAEECLIPLEDLYTAAQISGWASGSIGPSMDSYRWGGRTWALPLDVATQVMARRPDRIVAPPSSWPEVEDLARTLPVALSLAGPHAILTLMSMVAGAGGRVGGPPLLPDAVAIAMMDQLHRLYRLRARGSETLNPIGLLEAMGRGDSIALVPLVFGYVTYAVSGHAPHAVAFSDTLRVPGGRGGAIGGTGIGFSRRATPSPELLAHIAWLMSAEAQVSLLPAFGGQPSARAAWHDPQVNTRWGTFYAGTARTAETALLRPRHDGYIAFQTAASELLRQALDRGENPEITLIAIRRLWTESRSRARGDLDDERG